MSKGKRQNDRHMLYKAPHRKLKIQKHEPNKKTEGF